MAQVAVSCGQRPHAVAALLIERVRLLECGDAGPGQIGGVDVDLVPLDEHLHPVVQPADHHRADRRHVRDVQPLGLPPSQPAFDRLAHRQHLRHGERHGRVDADAVIGGFLDGLHARAGDRRLNLHVGGQRVEIDGLPCDGFGVAVVLRIRLDGETALLALVLLEDRQEQPRAAHGHLRDELPGDLVLRPRGVLRDDLADAVVPEVAFLLEDHHDNLRVRRRADCAVLDAVGQLLHGAGVIPVIGAGSCHHLLQWAEGNAGHRHSSFGVSPTCLRRGRDGQNGRRARLALVCIIQDPQPSVKQRSENIRCTAIQAS